MATHKSLGEQAGGEAPPAAQLLSASTACDACKLSEVDKDAKFKRCSACYAVWYCSQECQRSVWSTHKLVCKQQGRHNQGSAAPTSAADVSGSRLQFFFGATANNAEAADREEEGDDAEDGSSYSASDDEEDHYSGYKAAEFDYGVSDLDQRLRHLSVASGGGRGHGGIAVSPFGGVVGSPLDEDDREMQLAIQASIKEEEERVKKEEERKKNEEEAKKKEDEIRKSQDEIQAFYRRSLAKSREGGGELGREDDGECPDGADDDVDDVVDDDDLLYDEDDIDSDDFDEAEEDDDIDTSTNADDDEEQEEDETA